MVSRACSPMVFLSTDRSPAGAGGALTSLCRVTPRHLAEVACVVLEGHQHACADPRREMWQAASASLPALLGIFQTAGGPPATCLECPAPTWILRLAGCWQE